MAVTRTDFPFVDETVIMELVCDDCGEVDRTAYIPAASSSLCSLIELTFKDCHLLCSGDEVDIMTGLPVA